MPEQAAAEQAARSATWMAEEDSLPKKPAIGESHGAL